MNVLSVCPWCHTTVDATRPNTCPGIVEHSQEIAEDEIVWDVSRTNEGTWVA